jgi:hypothetical protein
MRDKRFVGDNYPYYKPEHGDMLMMDVGRFPDAVEADLTELCQNGVDPDMTIDSREVVYTPDYFGKGPCLWYRVVLGEPNDPGINGHWGYIIMDDGRPGWNQFS